MSKKRYYILNLPNPPKKRVYRDYAGGFGTIGAGLEDNTPIPQYLLYGASALENQGLEYEILDAPRSNYSVKDVLTEIENSGPDVLIAWLSLPSLVHDIRIMDKIKEVLPETFVIAYGTVCNVLQREILEKSKIDALIIGNYPYYVSISNLVTSFNGKSFKNVPGVCFKNNDKIISNPPTTKENLDELNLEVYHKISVKKYLLNCQDRNYNNIPCIPIVTGVGCPYSCIYCPYPLGFGKNIITKSNRRILQEIDFLMENYGINGFLFREQAFTYDKKRILKFCEEILRKKMDIRWLFETRADLIDRDLLEKMKKAGCFRIHYGVETGDEETLKKIGKHLLNGKKIIKAFHETKKAGIFAHAHMMIGFPEDSWDTINNSIKFLEEIEPDGIHISIVTPYPGTELYDYILENNFLISHEWSMYTGFDTIIRTRNLGKEELKKAKKKMKMEFYKHKIKKDPKFRRVFLKKLPRKLWDRLTINRR